MAINYLGQLKDRSPDRRKEAIKAAARAADKKALKTLAMMVEDDPDPDVRELAKRAGVHIRQQIGELPMTPRTNGKSEETPRYNVTEENIAKGRKAMDVGVTFMMNGESSKAIKPLREALKYNPNLRYDGYFRNIVESTTGLSGDDAIAQITDAQITRTLADRELSLRKQAALNDHLKEIGKGAWGGVAFAVFMMFFVVIAATFFASVMLPIAAKGYTVRYEDNLAKYDAARLNGTLMEIPIPNSQEKDYKFPDPDQIDSTGSPRMVDLMKPSLQFETMTYAMASVDVVSSFIFALMVAGGVTAVMLVGAFLAHLIASAMGGHGSLKFTMEEIPSFFTRRMGIAGALAGVLALLAYELFGSALGIYVMVGLPGIILLLAILGLFSLMSRLYHANSTVGMVASLPLVGMLVGGAALIVLPLIA